MLQLYFKHWCSAKGFCWHGCSFDCRLNQHGVCRVVFNQDDLQQGQRHGYQTAGWKTFLGIRPMTRTACRLFE